MTEKITILGSSGSIGVNTLDVISRHRDRYEVFALTGQNNVEILLKQCNEFSPRYVVVGSREAAGKLIPRMRGGTEVLVGEQALVDVASDGEVNTVMAAIVGSAGLLPTLAAAQQGKKVLLANKESLVMAGRLFMDAVRENHATLLPIDSEHNAIFQCLPMDYREPEAAGVSKVLLSGSGGPFRTMPVEKLRDVTPDQACAHPNWSMGRKISVDSATMMNKGLELIEACWLFDVPPDRVEIIVHPQSIIHSLVSYVDGSVLAQLGNPDMRTPIAHALAWPQRVESGVDPLDLVTVSRLDFEAPDTVRFPCLKLARDAAVQGLDYPAVLNAANEVAVAAFLAGKIGFTDIAAIVASVLERWNGSEPVDLASVQLTDKIARQEAISLVETMTR